MTLREAVESLFLFALIGGGWYAQYRRHKATSKKLEEVEDALWFENRRRARLETALARIDPEALAQAKNLADAELQDAYRRADGVIDYCQKPDKSKVRAKFPVTLS